MSPRASPLPLLLATGGLIGATFPLGKLAGEAGVPPLVWSFLIAAGSALVLVAALAMRREAVAFDLRHLRYDLIAGVVSLAIPNALVFSVIPRLGAGFTSILFTLSPILTLAFSAVLRLRRTTPLGIAGIAVGFAGALVIVVSKGQVGRPAEPAWLVLALLIPVSLAVGNVYRTLYWPPGASGLRLAAGMNIAAAIVLALASLLLLGDFPVAAVAATPALSLLQVASSAAMFAFFFRLQAVGGPVYLSQIGYVAAAVGLASGSLLLGESYGALTWLGAAVVAAGVAMTTIAQVKR
jgi:drug/metabolite transporter (DMT)-like permease